MGTLEIILLSIAGVLTLGLFVAVFLIKRNNARQKAREKEEALELLSAFERDCNDFRLRIHMMDEHMSEYSAVFQEAGWSRMITTMHNLDALEDTLKKVQASQDFPEITRVIKSLNGIPLLGVEVSNREAQVALLALGDWKLVTRATFINLIERLHEEALRTQELGVKRERKRLPTLTALAALRDSLGIHS